MQARMSVSTVAAAALVLATSTALTSADASAAPPGAPPNIVYEVTIKQWIPFASVVDPFMASPVPYATSTGSVREHIDPNCTRNTDGRLTDTDVTSSYHGDDHLGFDGSYRVIIKISFDFNGAISDLRVTAKQAGRTIRNKIYVNGKGQVVDRCAADAVATTQGGAKMTSFDTFDVSIGGPNPLAFVAPTTFTSLTGKVEANGDLSLDITTKNFPNSGVQVTQNGTPTLTEIANDVSCLNKDQVTGKAGAAMLFAGLSSEHTVHAKASLTSPSSERVPSELCGL